MLFNAHTNLKGLHAFLSPSKYHWLNYDDEKLDKIYSLQQAAQRGTELHDFAHTAIKLKQKLPATTQTLNMYVNDAIGFDMSPEQVLYYSNNCFGEADTISFRRKKLRIHDLKTGVTPASMKQLMVYAGLYCLEYRQTPFDIQIILRIYQNDMVEEHIPDPEDVIHVMERIKYADKRINQLIMERLT